MGAHSTMKMMHFFHLHSELIGKFAVWLHTYPLAELLNNIFVNYENVMFEMSAQSTISEFFKWHVWNGYSVNHEIMHFFADRGHWQTWWLHTYPLPELLNNRFVNFENDMFEMGAQSTMKLCISFICSQRSLTNMVITHLSITWTFE